MSLIVITLASLTSIDWTTIIVALITSVIGGGVGLKIVEKVLNRLLDKKKITAAEAVRINLKIYEILENLRNNLGAHSVVLIETENGEKLSRPGQLMYVTMIAEAIREKKYTTQSRWIEVPVDITYNNALRALLEARDNMVFYTVEEFPSHTLQDMYLALGVTACTMTQVQSTPNYIRYISVRTDSPFPTHPTPVERSVIKRATQELSQIYK